MSLMMNNRLGTTSVMCVGVVSVVCVVHSCGLDFGCCLNSTGIGVAAPETCHEGWLCGSGLDHSIVAAGMHVEGFFWVGFWVGG
jgi:hypothetical protein